MRSHEKSSITFIRIRSSSLALMHLVCRRRIAIWICWSLWNQICVRQSEVPRLPESVARDMSQWILSCVRQKKSGPACETSIHFLRIFSNLDAPFTSHPGETDAWVYIAEEDFRTATTMVRKRKEPAPDNGFAAGTANRLGNRSGHFQTWFVIGAFGIPVSVLGDCKRKEPPASLGDRWFFWVSPRQGRDAWAISFGIKKHRGRRRPIFRVLSIQRVPPNLQ